MTDLPNPHRRRFLAGLRASFLTGLVVVLPIGLTIFMIIGWFRSDLMPGYRYPKWLLVIGTLATALTWYMGVMSIGPIFALLGA